MSTLTPKLRPLALPINIAYHRSGWNYALASLRELERPDGILFDSMADWDFLRYGRRGSGTWPRREQWVGVLHNPHNMPPGHYAAVNPQVFMRSEAWSEGMKTCQGLYALSEYHAVWLRTQVCVPVCVLHLPTETPSVTFGWDRFLANPKPRVLHVGRWLRRFLTFFKLEAPSFSKALVNPGGASHFAQFDPGELEQIELIERLTSEAYDAMLSENLVFADFLDASANNVVVECIVRGTPILLPRHPAIVEYIGAEYPLLFSDVAEAGAFLQDRARLADAHRYLVELNAGRPFAGSRFRDAVASSEIYARL